jgi:hypothetical protein
MFRKIFKYYVPGHLSLIFLPILIGVYVSLVINIKTSYVIPLYYLHKDEHRDYLLNVLNKKKYSNIYINGNKTNDSISYINLRKFTDKIRLNSDSTIGLKIIFDKKIKYETFIKTIDQLLCQKVRSYVPIEDTIFVFYKYRTDDNYICNIPEEHYYNYNFRDCYFIDEVIYVEEINSLSGYIHYKWEKNKWIYYGYRRYWPIFLSYFILLILGIKRIVEDIKQIRKKYKSKSSLFNKLSIKKL